MLDATDDARSRAVAASGTIGADGSVGPVGRVHEKAIKARKAGAQLFLVLSAELSSAPEHGLTVGGAQNLGGALRFLQA